MKRALTRALAQCQHGGLRDCVDAGSRACSGALAQPRLYALCTAAPLHGGRRVACAGADAVTERRGLCDGGGKSPPPDWYKRGAWIDASEIEKRMVDREEGEEAAAAVPKEPVTPLVRQIKASIKFRGGPITVAEYMKEVLTNPLGGFYAASGSEAIGRGGHFITSPEISSLFGEILGVWLFRTYEDMGRPPRFTLVELGPGKGTLMRQMLTAIRSIPGHEALVDALGVRFVEVSPDLRRQQHDALQCDGTITLRESQVGASTSTGDHAPVQASVDADPVPRAALSKQAVRGVPVARPATPLAAAVDLSGDLARLATATSRLDVALSRGFDAVVQARSALADCSVSWHYTFNEVPDDGPLVVLGHEYLDALPVYQFVRDQERGWLEVLVQEAEDPSHSRHLEFVLSPAQTIAVRTVLLQRLEGLRGRTDLQGLEVNPQAMALAEAVAARIGRSGGAALFIDYGKDGPYENSLNAIRHHKPVHVLEEPGKADLTAWVDFGALRQAVEASNADASVHGPITQGQFLMAMGMEHRLDMLLQSKRTPEECASLEDGFAMLVAGVEHHPQGMGETFKALAITPSRLATPYPFDIDFAALQR